MKISEDKLREKLNAHTVNREQVLKQLAYERNNRAILTMPTLGVDIDTHNREAASRKKLDALEVDAAENIPILERLMVERGWSTQTTVCDKCGKHHTGRNTTCANCFEVDDEY